MIKVEKLQFIYWHVSLQGSFRNKLDFGGTGTVDSEHEVAYFKLRDVNFDVAL